MPRRRSTNPTKAISITLPESLLRRLDNYLSYESSRSAYIAKALERRLNEQRAFSVDDIETEDLVRWTMSREIPSDLKASLRTFWNVLTSSNRDEDL